MAIRYKDGLGKGLDGLYHYCVRVPWQKPLKKGCTGCTSLAAARKWLAAERDRWALERRGINDETRTLRKVVAEYEAAYSQGHHNQHATSTLAGKLRNWGGDLLELPLHSITTKDVEAMRDAYMAAPSRQNGGRHSPGGGNSLVDALTKVMRYAVRQRYVLEVPYRVVPLPTQQIVRDVVPLDRYPEFLAALDAPYKGTDKKHSPKNRQKNPHLLMAVRLMLGLGLREDETLNARWEWIKWSDGRFGVYDAGHTKNGKTRRVALPQWLRDWLWEHPGRQTSGYMMPRIVEGKPTAHRPQFTKKVVRAAGQELGIANLTPHGLRVTFATNHSRAGTPLRDIQVMLDHDSIETTIRYVLPDREQQTHYQETLALKAGLNTPEPTKDVPLMFPEEKSKQA